MGRALGLAPVHGKHDVAPLEPQLRLRRNVDDQDPAGSAEILAQVGVQRSQLEVG